MAATTWQQPDAARKPILTSQFEALCQRRTDYPNINAVLKEIRDHKADLLRVLERPEVPLHNNGRESDIREFVKRRKISGGTRSDQGRDCRDAFLGLAKTCAKLRITFWDYLGARLAIPNQAVVPPLPSLVTLRCAAA